MMPYYYINNDFNKAQNINNNLNRLIINYFYKYIDTKKD